jgi:hypothetical protein
MILVLHLAARCQTTKLESILFMCRALSCDTARQDFVVRVNRPFRIGYYTWNLGNPQLNPLSRKLLRLISFRAQKNKILAFVPFLFLSTADLNNVGLTVSALMSRPSQGARKFFKPFSAPPCPPPPPRAQRASLAHS